ncbi:MAG: deoxyribonuclease V [Cyanobacteria bacterium RI_101]|nr:deoxyribonuclease V [Cyanobacteria bacterium RI_101]
MASDKFSEFGNYDPGAAFSLPRAREIQDRGRRQICPQAPKNFHPRLIAGADVAFPRGANLAQGAIVVLNYPELTVQETALAQLPLTVPYIPGYLSFRELPVLLEAWRQLRCDPDLILCDGQGHAHPRRFGLACHLGLALTKPTIGVAKSLLTGRHEPVPPQKGAWAPLMDGAETLGAVLRSRTNVRPLYISVGHLLSLEEAVAWTQNCLTRYRLPEPTRLADKASRRR